MSSNRRAFFRPTRDQLAPKGAIKITDRETGAVVFVYDSGGAPCALAFAGKRNKPDLHVKYRSAERREQHVREYLDNLRKVAEYKAEQQAKRSGFRHSFKVGDILHHSWGWEQTNCSQDARGGGSRSRLRVASP
jgi:hypothetical protein